MRFFASLIAAAALSNVALAYPHAPAVTPAAILPRGDSVAQPQTTTTTKKTTSTKKTTTTTHTTTSSTPLCTPEYQKLVKPTQNQVIYYDPNDLNGITFEVIYCSGQYFKTSSQSADVWLGSNQGGQILTLEQKPDNRDVYAGYYSYRFNTTVFPVGGSQYNSGPVQFNLYEVATGYYNPNNYENNFVTINFQPKKTS